MRCVSECEAQRNKAAEFELDFEARVPVQNRRMAVGNTDGRLSNIMCSTQSAPANTKKQRIDRA